MTDQHAETMTLTLGSQERKLKLGPAALRLARRDHDVRLPQSSFQDFSMDMLVQMLWIGLLPEDRSLTEDQVIEWLLESDDEFEIMGMVMEAMKRMSEGMSRTYGDPGNAKKGRGKK